MDKELWEALDLPDGAPDDLFDQLVRALNRAGDRFADLNPLAVGMIEGYASFITKWKEPVVNPPGRENFLAWTSELLENPWFKYGVEIELAYASLDHLHGSIERFQRIEPVLSEWTPGPRAARYLREVYRTYLFGFHAACIALSGAALEQLVRDRMVQLGHLPQKELREASLGGARLLKRAKEEGVIGPAYAAARKVLAGRNRAMHRNLWDAKIIGPMAFTSFSGLVEVVADIGEAGIPDLDGTGAS